MRIQWVFTPKIAAKGHNFWEKWIETFWLQYIMSVFWFSAYISCMVFSPIRKKTPKWPYHLVDDAVFMLFLDIRFFLYNSLWCLACPSMKYWLIRFLNKINIVMLYIDPHCRYKLVPNCLTGTFASLQ